MRALTSLRHPNRWSIRRVLPSSHAPPLSNLLPPTTPTVTRRPPCLGLRVAPKIPISGLTSPFTRRLVNRERRIVFTCVAVDWILFTLLPTPPLGDAVTLELSTFFMVCVVLGLPPSGVVLLDGARVRRTVPTASTSSHPRESRPKFGIRLPESLSQSPCGFGPCSRKRPTMNPISDAYPCSTDKGSTSFCILMQTALSIKH
jgi:hypothetical protein